MKREKSCGAVLFTREGGELRFLLCRHRGGHHGFPKGHVEPGETEVETALREIYEEVGLLPELIEGFREETEYQVSAKGAMKTVVWFLGEFAGQTVRIEPREICGAELLSYRGAIKCLEHRQNRRLLQRAAEFLEMRGITGE